MTYDLTCRQIFDLSLDEDMVNPITELEILEAIGSMKSNKSSGSDRFTTEFYKEFGSFLTPILAALVSDYCKAANSY